MGRVLDHPQAVTNGEGVDRVDVEHQAADVDRHDPHRLALGPGGKPAAAEVAELALCVVEVEVQGARVAVDEHRHRPQVEDHLGGGGEGHRRHQHGLAGLQPQGRQRQVERRRTRAQSHGAARPHGLGEGLLEAPGARSGGQPPGAQGGDHLVDFSLPQVGPEEGNGERHSSYRKRDVTG